ncbi:hypothetical protein [Tomitella gaofuii]|nr:hypothetical protein [Tomitella gaofuii]
MIVKKIQAVSSGAHDAQYASKAQIVGADGKAIDLADMLARIEALEAAAG